MNALAHPYWTIYGVIVSALHGLLIAHASKNGSRDPEDRVPIGGYLGWAVLNFIWPVLLLILAILLVAEF